LKERSVHLRRKKPVEERSVHLQDESLLEEISFLMRRRTSIKGERNPPKKKKPSEERSVHLRKRKSHKRREVHACTSRLMRTRGHFHSRRVLEILGKISLPREDRSGHSSSR
jgi:hypothetical protein